MTVRPWRIYRHFKGDLYQTMAVAEHTEDDVWLVIYRRAGTNGPVFARPLDMFTEEVSPGVPRFSEWTAEVPLHGHLGHVCRNDNDVEPIV